jgi:SulP family sulfate permease
LKRHIEFLYFFRDLKNYQFNFFKKDLFAALALALLAIPQSIAYSLLAGLPPSSALYSSIFGTIFTAAFSSSKFLVASSSTGVSILIQTILSEILTLHYSDIIGIEKEILTINLLTAIVLTVGLMQILIGVFNLSRLLQFVSRSVVLGYLVGIVIAIIVNQSYYFIGIEEHLSEGSMLNKLIHLFASIKQTNFFTLSLATISLVLFIFLRKRYKKAPNALIVLIFCGLVTYGVNFLTGYSFFNFINPISTFSDLGFSSAFHVVFAFPQIDLDILSQIFFGALAIALLSILEVFSIARTLTTKTGEQISFNQETFSLGIANTFLGFVYSAMPVSGSFSRSYFNYENQAASRFAIIFSGIFVALIVYLGWPLVKSVPLATLASILIVIVVSLIDWQEVKMAITSTWSDCIVFLLTCSACLFFRLDMAFFIGIAISILLFLNKAASFHLVEYSFDSAGKLITVNPDKKIYNTIRIIGIGGEMFFAAVDLFEKAMQTIRDDPYGRVLILRLNGVYHMDASMCLSILRLSEYLRSTNRYLLISGISDEVYEVLYKADLIKKMGEECFFTGDETKPQHSTWKAYLWAQDWVEKNSK